MRKREKRPPQRTVLLGSERIEIERGESGEKMSGKGGGVNNGGRKGSSGISDIPAGSRKMVQSLKEIVNCPEAEIYVMLKECNMDPNEAVNRLLSQDPFREVKSKREKKKENKDTTDSRPYGANNMSNRGGRGGSDRYSGLGGATHFSSNESGNFHGRPANKKENGTQTYTGSTSSVGMAGHQPPSHSDPVPTENKILPVGLGDGVSSSQSSSGHQPAWFGAPGQRSMADIVKMGRPHYPPCQNANFHSEVKNDHEFYATQHVPFKEEWPTIEKPIADSVLEMPTESELCINPSDLQFGRTNQHQESHLDEVHLAENGPTGTLGVDQVLPDSVSDRSVQDDDSGGSSPFDDNINKNVDSYQTRSHAVELNEDEDDASSVDANLQQPSIDNHDHEASHEEDRPGVIIPNHLQVYTPECSQLSFGSFRGLGPRPLSNNLDKGSEVAPLMGHSDNRTTEFYRDEHLGTTSDGNMDHVANANAVNYDSSSDSQREVLKQENVETAQETQFTISSSEPGYGYENTQQLNTAFQAPQISSQMQNHASLSNVMQGYANSIPSTLLAQTAQNVRELDLQYSPFPVTTSLPTRNNDAVSLLSGPNISMSEALRATGISTPQPPQHPLSGTSVATGPTLPQHLAMHPYSQPTVPLTHFTNMIGYQLLPQSYPYMPSAFQQAFASNSSYHQSLDALLPQFKNNLSVSSLPQSATATASGYGFGNSSRDAVGNFPVNPQASPTGTMMGYEDLLSSQYKDASHLPSLQQNENSPMWLHGLGSRTMSAIPASTYYNLQGQQNQQSPGFRQAQQLPSQHYGSLGYPNFYQSQTGMSPDHLQQNPRDSGSLGGSQGQAPSKQTQQIWQNSY